MASVINTNMASLVAQRNLSGSQGALATSVERLSSGLRINRAKDEIQSELTALRTEASVAYKQDSGAASSDNRPFDAGDWFFGRNLDRKYPGGPAFTVRIHLGHLEANAFILAAPEERCI